MSKVTLGGLVEQFLNGQRQSLEPYFGCLLSTRNYNKGPSIIQHGGYDERSE